ncbi:MAG: immunity 17 family protein [Bacteroidia bacterium]|nr:immunity 17 family protein [Bacteroidia bacterium]
MEGIDLLVAILLIAGGGFSLLASIFNWDFYFEHSRARFFVKIFTRAGARVFYALLGLLLLGVGVYQILTETGIL